MSRVDCTEKYLNSLSPTHQEMLVRYRTHLQKIRECIDQNFKIIRKFINGAEHIFQNDHQINLPKDNTMRPNIRPQDIESVNINISNFYIYKMSISCW